MHTHLPFLVIGGLICGAAVLCFFVGAVPTRRGIVRHDETPTEFRMTVILLFGLGVFVALALGLGLIEKT